MWKNRAVDELERLLTNPPVLKLERAVVHYTVDTGACDNRVGYIMVQEQPDDNNQPICYYCRTVINSK